MASAQDEDTAAGLGGDARAHPRIIELEMRLAFQQETLDMLSSTLVDKERRLMALEDRVVRLESAIRIVASRNTPHDTEAPEAAFAEKDPVPHSG